MGENQAAAIFHCISVISFVTRGCHGLEFKSIVVINYLIVMILFAKKERERERHDIEQIELRNYTYKSEYSFYCRLLFSLSMNYDFIK